MKVLIVLVIFHCWATAYDNMFLPYAKFKDADQPAHWRSLIRIFIICCQDSTIPIDALIKISRLYLVSVAEQASLSLTWFLNSKNRFPCDVAWLVVQKNPSSRENGTYHICEQGKHRWACASVQSCQNFRCSLHNIWILRNLQTKILLELGMRLLKNLKPCDTKVPCIERRLINVYLQGPGYKKNYQINLKSSSGPINVLLVNKDTDSSSPVVVQVPPPNEHQAAQAIAAAQAAQNQNYNPNPSGKQRQFAKVMFILLNK